MAPKNNDPLGWLETQTSPMRQLLRDWAEINSGSSNLKGLAVMEKALQKAFSIFGEEVSVIPLPPYHAVDANGHLIERHVGRLLRLKKRPGAPIQVLLNGHMDTVFPANSPFQKVTELDQHTWTGPGVADLKGGLVVLWYALQALERDPAAHNLGWEVILNPDEEIGSPGSAPLLFEAAKQHQAGLIFEPSLPDGSFINERMGSRNASVVIHGRSAHVGREFFQGRHALYPIGRLMGKLEDLIHQDQGIIINVGKVEGGGAVNVVPNLGICHLNMRVKDEADMGRVQEVIDEFVVAVNDRDGFSASCHIQTTRPPKPFTDATRRLFEAVGHCCDDLGLPKTWKCSGGVCDGNVLASAGLPVIDTLGVRGGKIHTHEEFIVTDSLLERSQLCALFLINLASGKISLN